MGRRVGGKGRYDTHKSKSLRKPEAETVPRIIPINRPEVHTEKRGGVEGEGWKGWGRGEHYSHLYVAPRPGVSGPELNHILG